MNKIDFEKKLASLPETEPDDFDAAMIADATAHDDGTVVSLSDFKTLMDYSGKISLRIPRSLHMKLAEEAKQEGISLNQYALYKLARS